MLSQDTRQARDYFAQKLAFVTGPFELDGQIKRKEPITVVDVRLPSDFAAGHIPGAVNYPWVEVTDPQGFVQSDRIQQQRWQDIKGDREIIV